MYQITNEGEKDNNSDINKRKTIKFLKKYIE